MVGIVVLTLLGLGMGVCLLLWLRNNRVHSYRSALIDTIGARNRRAIWARDVCEGNWRVFDSVSYDSMLLRFWRKFDSFYPEEWLRALCEDKAL